MDRLIRLRAGEALVMGAAIVPPTVLIVLGYPWLGAATLGGVLASSTLRLWLIVRSERDRMRALLSYANDSQQMGGDPSTVITALRAGSEDLSAEQPIRRVDAPRFRVSPERRPAAPELSRAGDHVEDVPHQELPAALVYVAGDETDAQRVFSALDRTLIASGFEVASTERVAND